MSYSKRPALGQATMANSEPVVVASNQSTIPVESTTLNSLTETLQELSQRLLPLAGMANNAATALRVIPIASVSTAVTGSVTATGGGYITSTQSIAEKNIAGVMYTFRTANENLTATLANINNVVT